LYTEEDVERLRLLARATAGGHKIGFIARLSAEDLRRLVSTLQTAEVDETGVEAGLSGASGGGRLTADGSAVAGEGGNGHGSSNGGGGGNGHGKVALRPDQQLLRDALSATLGFDSGAFQQTLERAAVAFGHNGMLHRLVCPLAHELGDLWQRGAVTAAHEHFASAAIREFVARSARPFAAKDGAPRVIVATPSGQLHELGALLVAAAANNLGWRAVYLGASLPAAEIAGAAIQNAARAVLLSVVYPADDAELPADLEQLRRHLPEGVRIVVGGRAVESYREVLSRIGAVVVRDLEDLYALLERLRSEPVDQGVVARRNGH